MTLGSIGLKWCRKWVGASVLLAGTGAGLDANAEVVVPFDNSWKEQGFFRLFTNDYVLRGAQLDVLSDGTVSMLWRPVDHASRNASFAKWTWRVREGVIPTDLTVRGKDDRNLSVYFVFVDPDRLETLKGRSARRILREKSARALIYVWGGTHRVGSPLLTTTAHKGAAVSGTWYLSGKRQLGK